MLCDHCLVLHQKETKHTSPEKMCLYVVFPSCCQQHIQILLKNREAIIFLKVGLFCAIAQYIAEEFFLLGREQTASLFSVTLIAFVLTQHNSQSNYFQAPSAAV